MGVCHGCNQRYIGHYAAGNVDPALLANDDAVALARGRWGRARSHEREGGGLLTGGLRRHADPLSLSLMAGLLIAPVHLVAQSSFPPPASGDSAARLALRQTLRAAPSAGEVQLDGRLDEPAWISADSITDFRQLDPAEGEPSTERTVVRVLAGSDALYVGVRAYDRDMAAVRATQL